MKKEIFILLACSILLGCDQNITSEKRIVGLINNTSLVSYLSSADAMSSYRACVRFTDDSNDFGSQEDDIFYAKNAHNLEVKKVSIDTVAIYCSNYDRMSRYRVLEARGVIFIYPETIEEFLSIRGIQ